VKSRFDKARWDALEPLLDELMALDAPARAERIAELRRQGSLEADDLTDLLAQYAEMEQEGFLEDPLVRPVQEPGLQGQVIGNYTLDNLLGQGGMGTVWLAVKLLNPALLGPGGIERFRREGRALGRLTHPNIARLIDAGVTETGQPYLVIEYVEGETITKWCDSRQLDVIARVRLFLDVLAAVAHAHGKLILHRDLKPSNVMVGRFGEVQVMDWGLAKLITPGTAGRETVSANESTAAFTAIDSDRDDSEATRAGSVLGTPAYMPPEQAIGAVDQVDARSDVSAWGRSSAPS
jgi:eukaryotic-like serine/threonine-protein kinase